jgi:carbonic anhydrase/acetyltransferase-like protein (isoleucine patch superfamily)
VIFGSPAKAVREVSEDNVTRMRMSAEDYVKRGVQYKKELKRIG